MDEVFLRGMQFYGRHGVLPQEQVLGQRFIVHVRLQADLRAACASDEVADTVNYAAVHACVQARVQGQPVNLIERLAELIAQDILTTWPTVAQVTVEVEKPQAPIAGVLDTAGVAITRRRDELD